MASLADSIEEYLKKLLNLSASGFIDIKRKELSSKFSCVPSQVNYVLETRFTLEKGYLVESKRGGKGYVRLRKIKVPPESLLSFILRDIKKGPVDDVKAKGFIQMLYEEKYISLRESRIMEAVYNSLHIIEDSSLQHRLNGLLLRNMLFILLK